MRWQKGGSVYCSGSGIGIMDLGWYQNPKAGADPRPANGQWGVEGHIDPDNLVALRNIFSFSVV